MKLPPYLQMREGALHVEDVDLRAIADALGTPTYVYSKAAILAAFSAYTDACAGRDTLVCYAVKANANLAVLHLLAKAGAGFDIVSGGELERVLAAQGDPSKIIFSGVGKRADEMRAALDAGILCFNVESASELERLNAVAIAAGKTASISLRINPDVDAQTHPYISTGLRESKFGIPFADALSTYRAAQQLRGLRVSGIDCHIGSQLVDDGPLLSALDRLITLVDALEAEGIVLEHIDLGGGLGIRYQNEDPVGAHDYVGRAFSRLDAWQAQKAAPRALKVLFEPGRSVVGNAGVLLTRVEYLKATEAKNFAIVDAAMNDLLRPAMYEAWHDVVAVAPHAKAPTAWDIVGPVCESGDWLARARELALEQDDLLAFLSAGAYGMTMSSNYNTRPRAAEVLVDGASFTVVRPREEVSALFSSERFLP